MMKKILSILALISVLACSRNEYLSRLRASDKYVRNHVVLLKSLIGSCTGFNVTAPSGKTYIMSAAHCMDLMGVDSHNRLAIYAIDESGRRSIVYFVKVDRFTDLLILTNNNNNGMVVAKKDQIHDHVHVLSHGGGLPTYRTDGELLNERLFFIPTEFGFDIHPAAITTVSVIPGSSGAPVLNEAGEIVGVVSATDGYFGFMVPLHYVQDFLKGM